MCAKQVTKKVEVESEEVKIEKIDKPTETSSAKKRLTITPKQKKIGVGVVLACLLLGIGFVGGIEFKKNDNDTSLRPMGRIPLNNDGTPPVFNRDRMMQDIDDYNAR